MNFVLHKSDGKIIAELIQKQVIISNVDEAVDLLGNASYQGAGSVIVHKDDLTPGLFNLSSGIAGDILQKFSNYNMRLAIIGDFSGYNSKSLRDFIFESNKTGRVVFVPDLNEALKRLG